MLQEPNKIVVTRDGLELLSGDKSPFILEDTNSQQDELKNRPKRTITFLKEFIKEKFLTDKGKMGLRKKNLPSSSHGRVPSESSPKRNRSRVAINHRNDPDLPKIKAPLFSVPKKNYRFFKTTLMKTDKMNNLAMKFALSSMKQPKFTFSSKMMPGRSDPEAWKAKKIQALHHQKERQFETFKHRASKCISQRKENIKLEFEGLPREVIFAEKSPRKKTSHRRYHSLLGQSEQTSGSMALPLILTDREENDAVRQDHRQSTQGFEKSTNSRFVGGRSMEMTAGSFGGTAERWNHHSSQASQKTSLTQPSTLSAVSQYTNYKKSFPRFVDLISPTSNRVISGEGYDSAKCRLLKSKDMLESKYGAFHHMISPRLTSSKFG